MPDSLLPQCLSKNSLVYFLAWHPSLHFFIQSLSSFCSTCPYRCNLFCCRTHITFCQNHTHTTVLRLFGFYPGQPGTTRRNIHPLTLIVVINHPYLLHLLRSMASSLFNPRALQSFSTISVQVFFVLPFGLAPSTSYFIHFFTQNRCKVNGCLCVCVLRALFLAKLAAGFVVCPDTGQRAGTVSVICR